MTTYIIKSILCSGILLLFYHLFLEREKMHRFNRWYLLLAIGFAFVAPLISIEVQQESMPIPLTVESTIEELPQNVPYKPVYTQTENTFDRAGYLPIGMYGLVTLALLFRLMRNFRAILIQKNRHNKIQYEGAQVVLVPESIVTYSFLNYIFVGEKDFNQNKIEPEVLTHELAHVRQRHSLDIIFIELVQTLFWFNPLLFFFRKAIQLNHEFLADDAVLRESQDVKNYQLILLDKILFTHKVSLTSSFNFSITKKRLAMMTRTVNHSRHVTKQITIALLAFSLVFVFSEKIYSQKNEATPIKTEKTTDKIKKSKTPTSPEKIVRNGYKAPGPGLTPQEMNEYHANIKKYSVTGIDKGHKYETLEMSAEEKKRMYALFMKMNDNQHQTTKYSFFQMPMPVKSFPSEAQFESWKDPKVFGVWINDKKVNNAELEKYKASDIAEWWSSYVYANARKGKIYKYQLDLTTNDRFDKTYDGRVNDRIIIAGHIPIK